MSTRLATATVAAVLFAGLAFFAPAQATTNSCSATSQAVVGAPPVPGLPSSPVALPTPAARCSVDIFSTGAQLTIEVGSAAGLVEGQGWIYGFDANGQQVQLGTVGCGPALNACTGTASTGGGTEIQRFIATCEVASIVAVQASVTCTWEGP